MRSEGGNGRRREGGRQSHRPAGGHCVRDAEHLYAAAAPRGRPPRRRDGGAMAGGRGRLATGAKSMAERHRCRCRTLVALACVRSAGWRGTGVEGLQHDERRGDRPAKHTSQREFVLPSAFSGKWKRSTRKWSKFWPEDGPIEERGQKMAQQRRRFHEKPAIPGPGRGLTSENIGATCNYHRFQREVTEETQGGGVATVFKTNRCVQVFLDHTTLRS